ncbi:hypothetical protein [Ensifer sp. BR816]|nr:hypothetical protein [Ensifer sp. BR816]
MSDETGAAVLPRRDDLLYVLYYKHPGRLTWGSCGFAIGKASPNSR